MKTQIASALIVAAMALGSEPSIASPLSGPTNTIAVLQTTAIPFEIVANADNGSLIDGPNTMQVQFVNRGDTAATAVEFQVDTFGAPVATVEDVGTFAKGAIVNHSFANIGGPNSTVAVVDVKYADGSEWSANGQRLFVTRRQAAALTPAYPGFSSDY